MDREETGKLNRNREIFPDVLRVLATCAVVLMHTVTGVSKTADLTGFERRANAFRTLVDLTAWSVPVFLMISGYLFLNPEKKIGLRDAICKYCRRILLALILFGIPYSFLELLAVERSFRPKMIWEAVINTALGHSWAHMWYLYLILLLYALTPFIKWCLDKIPGRMVIGGMGALVIVSSILPFAAKLAGWEKITFPEAGIYLFYYLCGYEFAGWKGKGAKAAQKGIQEGIQKPDGQIDTKTDIRKRSEKTGWICLAAAVFLGILEAASRFGGSLLGGYSLDMAYNYPPTVLQAVCLFAGFYCFENCGILERRGCVKGVFRKIGELCFGIYLIHPVFLNLFYKYIGISPMNFRLIVGLPLFFGISLLGAGAVTFILRKIPVFRKYVL